MSYDTAPYRDDRGRFLPAYRDQIIADVQADYEGDRLLLREIESKYDISGSTIDTWARQFGWRRRQTVAVEPQDLIARLLALLSGQIADLETAMKNGATEAAMLSKLVTTLDRVLALKAKSTADKPRPSRRVEELRAKIAERIGELNRT